MFHEIGALRSSIPPHLFPLGSDVTQPTYTKALYRFYITTSLVSPWCIIFSLPSFFDCSQPHPLPESSGAQYPSLVVEDFSLGALGDSPLYQLGYYGISEHMSSYAPGSGQHFGQSHGREGDENIVQTGEIESEDVDSEVQSKDV